MSPAALAGIPRPMPVLFDLNGTLTDAGAMVAGWPGTPRDAALRALDDAVAQAMVDTITGEFRPFPEYVRAGLAHEAALAGLPDELVDRGVEDAAALPAFPDAARALRTLREAGLAPSVVTNSAAAAARSTLEAAGLADLLDHVVGADAVSTYKPDRRIYEAALEAIGAPAAETWLVAAHWWDVAGAKRAGLRTAWIARDEGALRRTAPEPDVRADDLADAAAQVVAAQR